MSEIRIQELEEKINETKSGGAKSNNVWKIRKSMKMRPDTEGHTVKHRNTGQQATSPEDIRRRLRTR